MEGVAASNAADAQQQASMQAQAAQAADANARYVEETFGPMFAALNDFPISDQTSGGGSEMPPV
jgi:hypothetical protein